MSLQAGKGKARATHDHHFSKSEYVLQIGLEREGPLPLSLPPSHRLAHPLPFCICAQGTCITISLYSACFYCACYLVEMVYRYLDV